MSVSSITAVPGSTVSIAQIHDLVAQACKPEDFRGKRVLMIVPDSTRTAPVGPFFEAIHDQIGAVTKALDVMIALGTHPPMPEEAMSRPCDCAGMWRMWRE